MISWTERIAHRLKHVEKDVPWWVNDKFKLYKFCMLHGIPMPKMLEVWKSPGDLDLSSAPPQFVLKPSVMHSAWGVMVLSATDTPNMFYEALSGRTLSEDSIRREQERVYEKCKYKGSYRLFTEERIFGDGNSATIPLDYKVFSFYGEASLVQQIDRNSETSHVAWFDGDFEPLDLSGRIESDWSKIRLGAHRAPRQASDMLNIAKAVTTKLATPFMRVDMFEGTAGPVVGELTPAPGGPYYRDWYSFTPEFDDYLGSVWQCANQRVEVDSPKAL